MLSDIEASPRRENILIQKPSPEILIVFRILRFNKCLTVLTYLRKYLQTAIETPPLRRKQFNSKEKHPTS
jgi:hypothetical protein